MRSCASTFPPACTSRSSSKRRPMPTGLLGRKVGMTQLFDENGRAVPVTVIQAGPCWVTQVKTQDQDGYGAIQVGFEESRRINSPERGHLAKAGTPMLRHIREWRGGEPGRVPAGDRRAGSPLPPRARRQGI